MKTLSFGLGLAAWLLLSGCAEADLGRMAFRSFIGKNIQVQVPAALDFPDEVTLEMGNEADPNSVVSASLKAMAEKAMGGSPEAKIGKWIKEAAKPLRSQAAEIMKAEVEKADLFGAVSTEKGQVQMNWGIGRWGIRNDKEKGVWMPIFDLEATLSVPGMGVVWRGRRSATDLGEGAIKNFNRLNMVRVVAGTKYFQEAMQPIFQDLGAQMMGDLAKARGKSAP